MQPDVEQNSTTWTYHPLTCTLAAFPFPTHPLSHFFLDFCVYLQGVFEFIISVEMKGCAFGSF